MWHMVAIDSMSLAVVGCQLQGQMTYFHWFSIPREIEVVNYLVLVYVLLEKLLVVSSLSPLRLIR